METLSAPTEAIRALERIARGGEPDAASTPARRSDEPSTEDDEPQKDEDKPPPPTDVQAVMSVLGRRIASHDRAGAALSLASTDLRRIELIGEEAQLDGAILVAAHLEGPISPQRTWKRPT